MHEDCEYVIMFLKNSNASIFLNTLKEKLITYTII